HRVAPNALTVAGRLAPASKSPRSLLSRFELGRDGLPDEELRLRRVKVLRRLASLGPFHSGTESIRKGCRLWQLVVEHCTAEVRERAPVRATVREAVVRRSGQDDARLVAELVDEHAGLASGDHDDAPLDSSTVEHRVQHARRKNVALEWRPRWKDEAQPLGGA